MSPLVCVRPSLLVLQTDSEAGNDSDIKGEHFHAGAGSTHELGVEIMCANTPAAKGRVERAHGTLQDRLVKEMRLEGISSMADTNDWTAL